MQILIAKLGATGDVVRTTPLLRRFPAQFFWITEAKNKPLLDGLLPNLQSFSWEERHQVPNQTYDLIINLEDTAEVASFLEGRKARQRFGAHADASGSLTYTEDSRPWFDLSLISRFGREQADRLKLENRQTYQQLIFDGLRLIFSDADTYLLPPGTETGLAGDVAIAAEAGPVWPMKNWAHYGSLKSALETCGLKVNVLPKRKTLLEHLADVAHHRCVVGGDSLPMHFALGKGRRCVTLFNCTSPWEIHEYGILTKIISPLLNEFFYKRHFDARATTAITLDEVFNAVMAHLR